MMETSEPGGSLVVPHATAATAASQVAAATASAVADRSAWPWSVGSCHGENATRKPRRGGARLCRLPRGGHRRRGGPAASARWQQCTSARCAFGTERWQLLCGLPRSWSPGPHHAARRCSYSTGRLRGAAGAAYDADRGHARSVVMPSFTACPSSPLLPAAPTVAPSPPPLLQELGSLLPRLSSADSLSLADGRLKMRDPSIAATTLHGKPTSGQLPLPCLGRLPELSERV